MKLEIGTTTKVTIEIDPQDAKFVKLKTWQVTPPFSTADADSYKIQEVVCREGRKSAGRRLVCLIYERRAGVDIGRTRIFHRNGNDLDFRFENLEVNYSPLAIVRSEQELPEGVVMLPATKAGYSPKFQGVLVVSGIKRFVGRPTTSIKRALQARDAYIREHNLDEPLLAPQEPTRQERWTYEPSTEADSQNVPA